MVVRQSLVIDTRASGSAGRSSYDFGARDTQAGVLNGTAQLFAIDTEE
jgi:hypothetical protein